ncbi:MAG: hypothetical protein WB402_00850 [Sulfuricaulis sp.]|uniref:hypothetical protein n=1 Tax=Sulfuricaulis sp. TaxID=2003553 RepID=UPI003C684AE6
MKPTLIRKSLIASSIALALGAPAANAALVTNVSGVGAMTTDSANFTMLDPSGYTVGGTNDVHMVWDGNAYNSSTDYIGPGSAVNVTASSTTAFFGHTWTAHDIQVFVPGTYSFNTHTTTWDGESGMLNMVVGTGQLGMHMLFDWGGASNIDMAVVWNRNSVFGSGIGSTANPNCNYRYVNGVYVSPTIKNCLYDGPGYGSVGMPNASLPWMLSSADGNGDGIMGIPMVLGGPFQTFNANFNANMTSVVPLPAAAWLFGSGLLGLLAVARRRKRA